MAAIVPLVRLTLFDPAIPVTVPPHEPLKPFGVATTSPIGNVSVNATPLMAAVFAAGFVMVNVRVVVAFCEI